MERNGNYRNQSQGLKPPKNKIARDAFYKSYGELLAREKIWEVKSSLFGKISTLDRFSSLAKLPGREGYTDLARKEIVTKAFHLFETNELARTIINIVSAAIFSQGSA